MDLSIVSEHSFCVLRGLGQRPNKHEAGGFRVNGICLFSQSGYRFALRAVLCKPRKWRKKRRSRFSYASSVSLAAFIAWIVASTIFSSFSSKAFSMASIRFLHSLPLFLDG